MQLHCKIYILSLIIVMLTLSHIDYVHTVAVVYTH